VAGSSGGQSYSGPLNHPVMITSTFDFGSMVIDIDGLRLDARFINSTGAVGDSFTIVKGTALAAPLRGASRSPAFLAEARPNPFESNATLAYSIPARGDVKLSILDLSGRHVRTLFAGPREPGSHSAVWDGLNERGQRLGPGVYFGVLEYQGRSVSRKLIRMQ
jgi:hypothetical protein